MHTDCDRVRGGAVRRGEETCAAGGVLERDSVDGGQLQLWVPRSMRTRRWRLRRRFCRETSGPSSPASASVLTLERQQLLSSEPGRRVGLHKTT
jgi:hypothetical protein